MEKNRSDSENDEPVEESFATYSKRRVPKCLEEAQKEGMQILKKKRIFRKDPRFDPRVSTVTIRDEEIEKEIDIGKKIKYMQKLLQEINPEDSKYTKFKKLITTLTQRKASLLNQQREKKAMQNIVNEQIEEAHNGKTINYMNKSKLKREIQKRKLDLMGKKQKSKLLARKNKVK